jgi:hypothetical protein
LNITFLKNPTVQLNFKILVFIFIAFICLKKTQRTPSYPTGDAVEYVLETEAFYRHSSPDIKFTDSRSFKASFLKNNSWDKSYKPWLFDAFTNFLRTPQKAFGKEGDTFGGLYVAKNGKVYGYHFFTYPLLNVPARAAMKLFKQNPLSAFKTTNAFLVLLTCFIILFVSPFDAFTSAFISLSFYFSSSFWYLGWIHPEVFVVCFVTLSLWLYFQNYFCISLILMAIATTQYQPLLFILLVLIVCNLKGKKLSLKTISIPFCCIILAALPALFYYYHFNTFSIINKAGYLDSQYRTFNRIFGFCFDINQGIILALPLVLILYIVLFFNSVAEGIKTRSLSLNILIQLAILSISYVVSAMIIWNHGQSVINRYATWTSAIILVHFFFLIEHLKYKMRFILIFIVLVSQIGTALYHEKISLSELNCYEHKPLARWVLNNYPSVYNPDPTIFAIRTNRDFLNLTPEVSPISYFDQDKNLCKILCHKSKLYELTAYGITNDELKKLGKEKYSQFGWIYVNRNDIPFVLNKELTWKTALYFKAKKLIAPRIYNDSLWLARVKNKAELGNISLDSAIINEALSLIPAYE